MDLLASVRFFSSVSISCLRVDTSLLLDVVESSVKHTSVTAVVSILPAGVQLSKI